MDENTGASRADAPATTRSEQANESARAPRTDDPATTQADQKALAARQKVPERQIRITRPRSGASLKDPVTLRVEVSGFQLVRVGTSTREDEGLLHAFVDREPPRQQGMLPEASDIVRSSKPRIRLPELDPGRHTVTVVGTYGIPAPFKPRVQDKVTFVVE